MAKCEITNMLFGSLTGTPMLLDKDTLEPLGKEFFMWATYIKFKIK